MTHAHAEVLHDAAQFSPDNTMGAGISVGVPWRCAMNAHPTVAYGACLHAPFGSWFSGLTTRAEHASYALFELKAAAPRAEATRRRWFNPGSHELR